ncbi:AP-3 complex subunit delta-1-like [Actinia tenebrosa]|uniref:AP-3 complex subunit delta n=1 Tax=Actinia tenebrosa TaxID=6105 RepID=A0A6P8IID1_ACTTE|nr:AP-3 complex subunit delta-1-like [Actinia tenebrosa]
MFEKNLTDLVRGIRNNKENEAKYIAGCLDDIKQELRQENPAVKANAVAKLTYLQMCGYDISWAAFNIIEVMSNSKFTHKRIGYLAASQSFHEGLDILMLTTNMLRKDLCSINMYDAGIALSGFSCFITPDLARDLANDVMSLLVSTKPYIRKRAVLLVYKIFLKFPEALRPAFPRLKEKLEDSDPGVQSASVNVICELARKNPKNYLSLAPLFFKLMTNSTNNWMLIKIIKLFGALCPLEPRLGKKLLEPLTNLIHSTSAMSLLYECVNTVIAGLPHHQPSIQLCISKLRLLLEDPDQNLKYLALLSMSNILKIHPKAVQQHRDIIIQCLDDKDESIRLRALDLIVGMVSKKNIMDIVKKLMIHMDKTTSQSYRDELLSKIILICSQSDYHYITNFEWYIDVLVQLTRVEGTRYGRQIASQMMDVTIRVKAIRPYAVQCLSLLLKNNHLLSGNIQKNGMCEVLYAGAWLSGEFSEYLPDIGETLECLLRTKATLLPGHIQAVYVQSIAKLYARILNNMEKEGDDSAAVDLGQKLVDNLPMFVQSADLEVQERASCIQQLIKYVLKLQGKGVQCSEEVNALFVGELNPVAAKAQKKVPIPEGLDLDKWINEPPKESSEEENDIEDMFGSIEHRTLEQRTVEEPDEEELEKRREVRRVEQDTNPHYLRLDTPTKEDKTALKVDDIPVANLDLPVSLKVSGISMSKKYKKGRKKKHRKGRHGSRGEDSDEEDLSMQMKYEVLPAGAGEMPEGVEEAASSEEDTPVHNVDDPHRLLDVDLLKPLDSSDALPVRTHRVVDPESHVKKTEEEAEEVHEKEKKSKKRSKKDKEKKSKHKHDKKEKEEKGKKSSHKHKHHHHMEKEAEKEEPDLMINGDVEDNADEVDEIKTNVEPGDEPVTQKDGSQPNEEDGAKLDDMDFWLTPSSSTANKAEEQETEVPSATPESAKTTRHRDRKSTESKEHKKKKDKREKKKSKKTQKTPEASPEHEPEAEASMEQDIVEVKPVEYKPEPPVSSYKVLAENSSLKLTHQSKAAAQNMHQLVVSIIFSNLTDFHIKSMEFNVLDSLNTKMVRPIGYSSRDSIPVPFQLLPGSSNEGQFAFNVENITMPQKLRGTLTYMIKDPEGSTSEKMDFSLFLPCSSFLVATPLSSLDFSNLLAGGSLTSKSSVKFNAPEDLEFASVIARICCLLHFSVVEQVDHGASLYSRSIQSHHICLLVKEFNGHSVSIDGKSTESSLLSNVLKEAETLFTS